MLRRLLTILGMLCAITAAGFATAIAFGGPAAPPPLVCVREAVSAREHLGDAPALAAIAAEPKALLAGRR
jgi:hypothetical protein